MVLGTRPKKRLKKRKASGVAMSSSIGGDIAIVPHPDDMDDETFIKHIDKRHRQDTAHDGENILFPKSTWAAWVPLYRSWHERLHEISIPGQYDHEHLPPSWLEEDDE